jgi:adenosine kinase
MARILVCGTLAWDLIGRFDAPLEPGTRNVKLDQLDEAFGGCAMNIAYNLRLLGAEAVPLAYVGDDFEPRYAAHVRRHGILEAGLVSIAGSRCARGMVFTGRDGAQFTAFYPGPTGLDRVAEDLRRLRIGAPCAAAILAPDLPEKTRICARGIAGVPLRVWCPGQYAEHLVREDLLELLAAVDLVVVNRHEWQALRAAMEPADLRLRPLRVVVTHGPEPVLVLPDRARVPVPPVAPAEQRDPTGCGDAFVAGLTMALVAGAGITAAVEAGIDLAARCLRCAGAQAH